MKPFIAKDTGKPLVVLGGYRIGEGGSIIRDTLPLEINKPTTTEDDKKLLAKYGVKKLEEMGYFGVLDRLQNSKLIGK